MQIEKTFHYHHPWLNHQNNVNCRDFGVNRRLHLLNQWKDCVDSCIVFLAKHLCRNKEQTLTVSGKINAFSPCLGVVNFHLDESVLSFWLAFLYIFLKWDLKLNFLLITIEKYLPLQSFQSYIDEEKFGMSQEIALI